MPSWIVPSDSHAVGDAGHTADHNHIADDLALIAAILTMLTGSGGAVFDVPAGNILVASTDGTTTSDGAVYVVAGHGIGIYSAALGAPVFVVPNIAATGGHLPAMGGAGGKGWGVSGSTASTGAVCFAIQNFNETGYGIGGCTFTCYDNDKVVTLNNTLDDGSGNMTAGGGLTTRLRTITASATLAATDSVVLLNAAALTATLPTAAGITGRAYTVKLVAASTTATVATTSSQTIDGATTYSLSASHKYVTVVSDGANWQITANN